jgi:hypothetical protein
MRLFFEEEATQQGRAQTHRRRHPDWAARPAHLKKVVPLFSGRRRSGEGAHRPAPKQRGGAGKVHWLWELRFRLLPIRVFGCCLLAVVCWLLFIGCCLLAAAYWLLSVGCCLLAAVYWLLPIGYCMLAAVYWLLSIGCCLLAIVCWLLFIGCCLLAAAY